MSLLSLSQIKKIHFIGIKGVAMSGLAIICQERGMEVRGSDVEKEFITDKVLRQREIYVYSDFSPSNLDWGPEMVVIGASWDKSNPEVRAAYKSHRNVILESNLRGELSREKTTIVVSGVHGKTTTTSLLSYIFTLAGLKPSYLIGTAMIPDLGVNGHWDDGKFFIVEGDEYSKSKSQRTAKFLDLFPDTSIITNVEWEHVDIYHNVKSIEDAFVKLIQITRNVVVACTDWKSVVGIIDDYTDRVITYGNNINAKWRLSDYDQKINFSSFRVSKDNKLFDEFELRLLGRFNALNAIACLIVALHYGIDLQVIKEAFSAFSGLERRLDTDVKKDIVFIDDYGHHPTEVSETLHAIRNKYMKRNIICVFQPHTASRTLTFLDRFSLCFHDVDTVIVTDIFSSARENGIGVTAKDLHESIRRYHPNAFYFGGLREVAEKLLSIIQPRDVVVTMGAGDVYMVKKFLMENI